MSRLPRLLAPALLLAGVLLLSAGCGGNASSPAEENAEPISLETEADSLAMRMYEAHGGPEVWKNTPALAFAFGSGRASEGDTTREVRARHWWRRSSGEYRVEWSGGPDSSYAAVFSVGEVTPDAPPSGQATLNGQPLDGAAEERALMDAQSRFVNDTYWLLAPLKLFDEGVNRTMAADTMAADSAEAEGEVREALHLSFGNVGITTEDQYWLTPDSTTSRLARWTFALQGMGPEQPPGTFRWAGYETFSTPAGSLALATRKENTSGPGVVYTDEIRTPASLPDSLFSME